MGDLTDIRDRITRLTLSRDLHPSVWSELCKIDSDLRAALRAQTASAERVRAVVIDAADEAAVRPDLGKSSWSLGFTEWVADRVAAQLTAPAAPRVNAELAMIGPLMTRAEAEAEQLRAEHAAERDDERRYAALARVAELESELAASEVQRDVYRDRAQRMAAQITEIEIRSAARCDAWLPDGTKCGRPGKTDGRIGWRCAVHWRNLDHRPAPCELSPEELDVLERMRTRADRKREEWNGWPTEKTYTQELELLDKILAAHRCPEPTAAPLPEVIRCGTEGCVSSIKKSYLPSGWLLHEGTWRCPRCKVVATSEAS